ncbi:MAG: hypothetical protein U0570_08785 [Phycisphaerales bacterium]
MRFLLVLGAVCLAGCASKQAAKPSAAETRPAPAPAAAAAPALAAKPAPTDPIKMSQMREKAILLIEQSAASSDAQVRGYACEGASLVPNRLGQVMLHGLDDVNPGVKAMAAMAAGRTRYQPASPKIASLESDPSPFVRMAGIYGSAKLGRQVDPTPLAGYLTGSDPLPVRSQAAWVLGEIGNRSALPMLREAAVEHITKARPIDIQIFQLQCAEAEVKLGDNDPIQGIRAALFPARPEDFEAAVLAVQIIGEVKDARSMDQLIYLSEYRDSRGNHMPAEFRMACATALAKLGLDRGSFLADDYAHDPNPTIRQQAASVYGYTARAENFPTLEAMMNDPSPMVRVVAATSVIRAYARINGDRMP